MTHRDIARRVDQISRIVWLTTGAAILAANAYAFLSGLPGPMPVGDAISGPNNATWSFFDGITSTPTRIAGVICIIVGLFQRPLPASR